MDSIKKQSGNNERKEIRVKSREDRVEEETAVKTPVKDTAGSGAIFNFFVFQNEGFS